ncbi:MAG: DUF1501 domain-containing protein, partial [Planctomycetales bacterium]
MLTLSHGYDRDCEGYSRRDFLRIGSLALGGLSLPSLLAARAAGAEKGFARDKAVVFLFLRGGATQFETWDPKMTAPVEFRAMFGETKTNLPGVTFGSHFSKLSQMADRLAIVRSFTVGSGNHGTGRDAVSGGGNPMNASMGALYSRLAGSTSPLTGMPTNAIVTPRAVGSQYAKFRNDLKEAQRTGTLGEEYKAFDPGAGAAASTGKRTASSGGGLISDMQLRLDAKRLD